MSVKLEIVDVTPEMAGKWLDRHWARIEKGKFKQRPLSISRYLRYAQAMGDGQWRFDQNPVIFDTNDNLANGQHRLEAIRRSGVTIKMVISTGNDPEIIDVCDIGGTRSASVLLALKNGYGGYSGRYSGAMGAIVRIAFRGHHGSLTFANCEHMLEKMNLKASVDAIMAKSPAFLRDFQSYFVGPLAYYHTVRPGKAVAFADEVFNFETSKGSPTNLFSNWIKSGRWQASEPGKAMPSYQRKLTGLCACLRAWDSNATITRVVPTGEAAQWLGDQNPKLRDWITAHVSRRGDKITKSPKDVMGTMEILTR